MRKVKVTFACLAVAGLAVLNFTFVNRTVVPNSVASTGSCTDASASMNTSSTTESEEYGYNPTTKPCPYPNPKREIVCGKLVKGGSEEFCVNSSC